MFYERLGKLCEKNGVTISYVTIHVFGCGNSTATGWKKGAQPSAAVVAKAAAHFGVSADYLLGLIDEPKPIHAEYDLSESESGLIEKLRHSDEITRRRAINCALAAMDCIED